MKKRLSGILLSLVLMLMMMPVLGLSQTGYAESESPYGLWIGGIPVTEANKDNVLSDGTVSFKPSEDGESGTLTLAGAAIRGKKTYLKTDSHDYTANIYSEKIDLNIVLEGENTLDSKTEDTDPADYAILVCEGVTIEGSGTLTANGHYSAFYATNDCEIRSGVVTATSVENSAIKADFGNCIISGGVVTATSGNNCGIYAGKDVTISKGTVTATGTYTDTETMGSGIYAEKSVTVEGGIVTATGYNCGVAATNSITISNGTVIAQDADSALCAGKGILINGGNVTAAGTLYGIVIEDGALTISGGNVTATGASAGIAAGKKEAKDDVCINFTGGKVTASGEGEAISGIVKNDIEGTGWKNVEGTEGETAIGLSSESGQFLSVYKKVQFPKPAATVKTVPTAKYLTENGSAQELVNKGTAEGGTMQYALGNAAGATEDYYRTIPKGTEAGDYYVWYKAAGDKTHADSEAACVKVTIAKQNTAPSDPTAVGTVHGVASSIGKYVVTSSKTVSLIKAPNRASYTIPATVKINGKTFKVTGINAKAFKGTKVKTLTVKTKKLTKKSVKASLKSSKIKTVKIKVGKKKLNRKYVKKYKKIFTKKNAGRKVKIIS